MNKAAGVFSDGSLLFAIALPPIASAGETRGYPGGSDEGMARSGSGLSYVLACNSADSESREPVLQHAMYYRLYHRSWFAGCKTYARHMARRGAPASLRDRDRRSAPEGCFPTIQAAWSRPGNLSGSWVSQASQRVSRGVVEGRGKHGLAAGTHGPPHPPPVRLCRWEGDFLWWSYRGGKWGW